MKKKNIIIISIIFFLLIVGCLFLAYVPIDKGGASLLPSTGDEKNLVDSAGVDYKSDKPKLDNNPLVKNYNNIDIKEAIKDTEGLSKMIKDIGIKNTMALLVQQSGGGSIYDCHQEAHKIGRIGYKVEKEKAFQSCDASCHSGCYHGAMESFLSETGVDNLAENISRICSTFSTSFGNFECLHGVGHGILAYVDYDMPEAIKECQKLSDGWSKSSCYGGVFMENILTGQGLGASAKVDHATDWVNKTDPYFPCDKIDKDHDVQYQCYQMQTSWMLTLANYNFDTVAKQCLSAPDNMESVCFKSFGRDAAGNSLRNPVKILEYCSKVPDEKDYYDQCITGGLNVIVDFWGPALKDQATQLCMLMPESPHKQSCYQLLANRLPGLFNDKNDRDRICKTFESSYQNLCM